MPLEVLTGLPGAGKSSRLIRKVNAAIEAGRTVATFACSDSPILRARPSLRHGRLASRTPQLSMPLTHFVSLPEAVEVLSALNANAVAGFDEAQYFGESIVRHWLDAASRGVDVVVATPSPAQLAELERRGVAPTVLELRCEICQHATASRSYRLPERDSTLSLCDRCAEPLLASVRAELLDRLRRQGPHPGEKSLYQPVELPELKGWKAIRQDSEQRADILAGVATEALAGRDPSGPLPTYLDVGCNTGYLCHLMRRHGFLSTGVEVVEDDLVVARLLECYFRRDATTFIQADAYDYLRRTPDECFDVTSAFSVFQWVIIQKSPQHGIDCIKWLFEKTRSVCVLEMGDWSEAHYRERIGIDVGTDWTRELMEEHGRFDEIRVFGAQEHALKRDLVVGIKR
jgi:SAM-dependent methyltransferase